MSGRWECQGEDTTHIVDRKAVCREDSADDKCSIDTLVITNMPEFLLTLAFENKYGFTVFFLGFLIICIKNCS